MTIRFLTGWNGFYEGQIVSSLSQAEETRVINLGFASADLDGGNDPAADGKAAKEILVSNGSSGAASAWVPASHSPERFGATLAAGGTGATITLDGSNDGITSGAQLGIFTLDTASSTLITPALSHNYLYIRATVVTATGATVTVTRGT